MSRKSNRQTRNQANFLGALLMESMAVVVMIGLFFVVQNERANGPTADEFVRPKVIEEAFPNLLRPYFTSQDNPAAPARNVAQLQVSTEGGRLVSTPSPNSPWYDPFGRRQ
jgi:hypothetical protein